MSTSKYNHLNLEERELLFKYKALGYSYRYIGKVLGRSHSTLCREFVRNAKYGQEYIPCKAQNKYIKRCVEQRSKAPLKEPALFLYVRENLRNGLSPGVISGRLPLDIKGKSICAETIYQYIYKKHNRKEHLDQYLPLKRKKRMCKNGRKVHKHNIIQRLPIEERPSITNQRLRLGDWEVDLMEGNKQDKSVVQVILDRKSRYLKLAKLNNKKSKPYTLMLTTKLQDLRVKTITSDNGLENSNHQEVSKLLGCKYYFCNPYHSWEKGSVENVIKLVRRFIPKGESISMYSDKQIQTIEDYINNYPRKVLNYKTPREIMLHEGYKV